MSRLARLPFFRSSAVRSGILPLLLAIAVTPAWTADGPFRRGDVNDDGQADISDALALLMTLFTHDRVSLPCQDAADANDDGRLNLADPVQIIIYLFLGIQLPEPSWACGLDPTADDLGCDSFHSCPIMPGDPILGLTDELMDVFRSGGADFRHEFTPAEGLGPVFIESSCASCHSLGGVGGGDSLDDPNHLVRRFATTNLDGSYNPMASQGGDVWQTRSIAGMVPGCSVAPEVQPAEATIHSARNPIPLFGDGLLSAVPDAEILGLAMDRGDGVHGHANLDPNGKPGRFGWKAQGLSLQAFNATAFNATMGITTPQSSLENPPQGQELPPECAAEAVGATSPNDPEGSRLVQITDWALLLAPPREPVLDPVAKRGQAVFEEVGCDKCHKRSLQTGNFSLTLPDGDARPVEALSQKSFAPYTDLLLHDMGPDLDDQVTMRKARGSEFRTAPLWGIGLRRKFLHDGRTSSLDDAIRAHGGEGQIIRDRYVGLSGPERAAVVAFLERL